MNQLQTEAMMFFCKQTFGHLYVPIDRVLRAVDIEASNFGITREDYLNLIAEGYVCLSSMYAAIW